MNKNEVLSMGFNNSIKTHPLAEKFNYKAPNIHSELACIVASKRSFKNSYMVNVRIDNNNKFNLSKPCRCCQRLLLWYNIDKVFYTTIKGIECLNLKTNQANNMKLILKF